jgi:hypothetical protein
MYYYCTLAGDQAITYNEEKWEEFVDINDIYTSFLFNLLEESLSIKSTAEDLSTYETSSDSNKWVNFYSELATLVYLILDFESATAAANPTAIEDPEIALNFFATEPMKPKKVGKSMQRKLKEMKPITRRDQKDIILDAAHSLLKSFSTS